MKNYKKQGFTLLELLVVIFIIGALSALLLPNFMSSRERARDAQRKNDLKQIQTAMEMYKQDQSQVLYPTPTLPASGDCWSSGGTGCTGNIYIKKFPSDPINNSDGSKKSYHYTVDNTNLTFTLCACLENEADPDRIAGNCEDTNYICAKGVKYILNEP